MLVGLLAVALLVAAHVDRLARLAVGGLPLRVVFEAVRPRVRELDVANSTASWVDLRVFRACREASISPHNHVVARGNNETHLRVLRNESRIAVWPARR